MVGSWPKKKEIPYVTVKLLCKRDIQIIGPRPQFIGKFENRAHKIPFHLMNE